MPDHSPDDFTPDQAPDFGNTYNSACAAECHDTRSECIEKGSPAVDCEDAYRTCSFACDRTPVRDSDP